MNDSTGSGSAQPDPTKDLGYPRQAAPHSPGPEAQGITGTSSHINTEKRTPDERRSIFAQQLQQAATRKLRVESQQDYQAVLIEGQPVNNAMHGLITVLTCGIWGIGWIIIAVTGGTKRHQLVVDEFGNVHWQLLG